MHGSYDVWCIRSRLSICHPRIHTLQLGGVLQSKDSPCLLGTYWHFPQVFEHRKYYKHKTNGNCTVDISAQACTLLLRMSLGGLWSACWIATATFGLGKIRCAAWQYKHNTATCAHYAVVDCSSVMQAAYTPSPAIGLEQAAALPGQWPFDSLANDEMLPQQHRFGLIVCTNRSTYVN